MVNDQIFIKFQSTNAMKDIVHFKIEIHVNISFDKWLQLVGDEKPKEMHVSKQRLKSEKLP